MESVLFPDLSAEIMDALHLADLPRKLQREALAEILSALWRRQQDAFSQPAD